MRYSVLVGVLWVIGCTQQPGALRMELISETVDIEPGTPIQLTATITAEEGPVCLSTSRQMNVEISRADGSDNDTWRTPTYWVCGTSLVAAFPLIPLIMTAQFLDVGDIAGRYEVIEKGDVIEIPLRVVLHEIRDRKELRTEDQQSQLNGHLADWPLGTYKVKVVLDNSDHGGLVQPFFWRTYQPPVEREVLINVRNLPTKDEATR